MKQRNRGAWAAPKACPLPKNAWGAHSPPVAPGRIHVAPPERDGQAGEPCTHPVSLVDAPALPYDALQRATEVEEVVMQGPMRKYYRFRPAPYYGGIATADAVGCDLACAYCWNYDRNYTPSRAAGDFYTAEHVAQRLLALARKKKYTYYRLTGSEPILGERSFEHFLAVKDLVLNEEPLVLPPILLPSASPTSLCLMQPVSALQPPAIVVK